MNRLCQPAALAATLLCNMCTATAAPLETTFTYQGELTAGGQPANGQFDLRFELYDADTGGAQAGSTIIIEDVVATDGVFTSELDFGAGPFAGDQLWIGVGVRNGSETGGFTELLPRQKLTAAPYALHAEMVAANAISSAEIANGSVGAGDINASQVQRRVTGTCAAGSYVAAVNADGSVSCTTDGPGPLTTQTLAIGASSFSPRQSTLQYQKILGNGGAYITGGTGFFAALVAPVELPHGATVTQIRATFYDNSVAEDLRLVFGEEFSDTRGFDFIGDTDTSGAQDANREMVVLDSTAVIDNQTRTYFVWALNSNWVSETANLRIVSYEIDYQLN